MLFSILGPKSVKLINVVRQLVNMTVLRRESGSLLSAYQCIESTGMTGSIVLDANGDREPDYWINDMMPDGTFVRIAEVLNTDDGARVRARGWRGRHIKLLI